GGHERAAHARGAVPHDRAAARDRALDHRAVRVGRGGGGVNLDLARLQFAITTIYHFLFVPVSTSRASTSAPARCCACSAGPTASAARCCVPSARLRAR